MIDVFYIGQGDTNPPYPGVVRNAQGVKSLSTVSTVYFLMQRISTGSVIVSAVASILETSVVDANLGRVQYLWAIADTQNTGEFAVAFQFITGANGFTLPRNSLAKVVVENKFATG